MKHGLKNKFWPTAVAVVATLTLSAGILAMAPTGPARADTETGPKQIELTEQSIQAVIAAQTDLKAFVESMKDPGADLTPDDEKKLEEIAVKHGFETYDTLENATATVSIILAGVDKDTAEFTEPVDVLKQELADIKADPDLKEEERNILIEELEQAIAADPKIEHPGNIELVQKYHNELEAALQ